MPRQVIIPEGVRRNLNRGLASAEVRKKRSEILRKAQELKDMMIKKFENHPVTKEVRAGRRAQNTSGTLSNVIDANLYSFIGFDNCTAEDPILPIIVQLSRTNFTVDLVDASMRFKAVLPTAQEIFEVTPMPWQSGRSWTKGIESGISGLNYYLRLKKEEENIYRSRSGVAVQTKKPIRSVGAYTPVKYISDLLKEFRTRYQKLLRKSGNSYSIVVDNETSIPT